MSEATAFPAVPSGNRTRSGFSSNSLLVVGTITTPGLPASIMAVDWMTTTGRTFPGLDRIDGFMSAAQGWPNPIRIDATSCRPHLPIDCAELRSTRGEVPGQRGDLPLSTQPLVAFPDGLVDVCGLGWGARHGKKLFHLPLDFGL